MQKAGSPGGEEVRGKPGTDQRQVRETQGNDPGGGAER